MGEDDGGWVPVSKNKRSRFIDRSIVNTEDKPSVPDDNFDVADCLVYPDVFGTVLEINNWRGVIEVNQDCSHFSQLQAFFPSKNDSSIEINLDKGKENGLKCCKLSGISEISEGSIVNFSVRIHTDSLNTEIYDLSVKRSHPIELIFDRATEESVDLRRNSSNHFITYDAIVEYIPFGRNYCFVIAENSKIDKQLFKSNKFYLNFQNIYCLGVKVEEGDELQIHFGSGYIKKYQNVPVTKAYLKKFGELRDKLGVAKQVIHFIHSINNGTLTTRDAISQFSDETSVKTVLSVLLSPKSRLNPIYNNKISGAILLLIQYSANWLGDHYTKQLLEILNKLKFLDENSNFHKFISELETTKDFASSATTINYFIFIVKSHHDEMSQKVDDIILNNSAFAHLPLFKDLLINTSLIDQSKNNVPIAPDLHEVHEFVYRQQKTFDELHPVRTVGEYDSQEVYLETYLRLAKYDCFYGAMNAVKLIVDGKDVEREALIAKNGFLTLPLMENYGNAQKFTVCAKVEGQASQKFQKP